MTRRTVLYIGGTGRTGSTMVDQLLGQFDTYFSLLYTVYSIPNMVLPFFGGYFVDKLGAPVCLLAPPACAPRPRGRAPRDCRGSSGVCGAGRGAIRPRGAAEL